MHEPTKTGILFLSVLCVLDAVILHEQILAAAVDLLVGHYLFDFTFIVGFSLGTFHYRIKILSLNQFSKSGILST